jgi:CheY-like chemotaxis protein
MTKSSKTVYNVLIADDSENDRILLKTALLKTARLQAVAEVSDGADVIAYLGGHAHFSDREKFPLPDLLLLDLKMPFMDGFEVLAWLKAQPRRNLTVVVLTDSMQAEHIKRALDLGADLFQVKPRVNHDRDAMILALEEYILKSTAIPVHHASVHSFRSLA